MKSIDIDARIQIDIPDLEPDQLQELEASIRQSVRRVVCDQMPSKAQKVNKLRPERRSLYERIMRMRNQASNISFSVVDELRKMRGDS
jgi:hypothetical protein